MQRVHGSQSYVRFPAICNTRPRTAPPLAPIRVSRRTCIYTPDALNPDARCSTFSIVPPCLSLPLCDSCTRRAHARHGSSRAGRYPTAAICVMSAIATLPRMMTTTPMMVPRIITIGAFQFDARAASAVGGEGCCGGWGGDCERRQSKCVCVCVCV